MVRQYQLNSRRFRIFLLGSMLCAFQLSLSALADTPVVDVIEMPSGSDLEVTKYGHNKESIVVWLPSEKGIHPALQTYAEELGDIGVEIWMLDLHQSYFLPPGSHSLSGVPLDDMVFTLEYLTRTLQREVIILSGQRGAQLSMIAARQWQIRNEGSTQIKGLVLLHPNLYRKTPETGAPAEYLPIARLSNLPIYLINAEYSTKSLRRQELITQLENGGSPVYDHWLKGVEGGFQVKAEAELQATGVKARQNFSQLILNSVSLLSKMPTPSRAVESELAYVEFSKPAPVQSNLLSKASVLKAPDLYLTRLGGGRFNLDDFRSQVVLINFWASWCSPCVEEMPSLERLKSKFSEENFELISVNIGEDRARVKQFLSTYAIDLPVLLDETGRSAKDWNVYVYPSSFIVDGKGRIRYAYAGGLQWDSLEIVDRLTQLILED
ncbi:MAG: TlpA disulfide reductase family protein [Pseudomonadota bacterium]